MHITRAIATADDGFLIVNKTKNMTSHDVVSCMRRLCNTRKIGHAGTLDPMATGVLVIAIGRATRMLQYISSSSKTYKATILLGIETVSDDAMGEIVKRTSVDIDGLQEKLDVVLDKFRGEILQAPSKVSAIKIDGKRAYDLVRQGKEVNIPKRPVTIYSLLQTSVLRKNEENPESVEFDIEVTCSSGTYIRSIARDIGEELGCGGHLTMLERTRVGSFALSNAYTLEELDFYVQEQNANDTPESIAVLPLAQVAKTFFPYIIVDDKERNKLKVGGFIPYKELAERIVEKELKQKYLEQKHDVVDFNAKNGDLKNKNIDKIYAAIYEQNLENEINNVEEGLKNKTVGKICESEKNKLVALLTTKGKFLKPICVFDV